MTDKVQKIREEVERIQLYTQSEVLKQVLDYIDVVQEEPVTSVWHDPSEKPDGKRYVLCYDGRYASIAHFEEVVGCKWAYVEELYKL